MIFRLIDMATNTRPANAAAPPPTIRKKSCQASITCRFPILQYLHHIRHFPKLGRNAQAARVDFRSHKQSFSGQAQEACDKALFSTEILASFNGMRGSDPPGRHCAELSKAGAYDSESACH